MIWLFYFVRFRKVATPLFDRNETVFEILMNRMAKKSLDPQLKLMAFVMVYVEICARGNVPIYYKATCINMQNFAVAGVRVIVVHTVIVI